MPTYGYSCPACGHQYEKMQKMSDETRAECPKCGTAGERIISGGVGVVFKGSGFYETDYRSESYKQGAEAAKKANEPKKDGASDKSKAAKPKSESSGSKSTTSKRESNTEG